MSRVTSSTTLAVTGATGELGHLVVEHLLDIGVPAEAIVAFARNPTKASDLSSRGVVVREADYDRPETLGPALDGVDRLLLISASEHGRRVTQHQSVIAAAEQSGVEHILYTSMLNLTGAKMKMADDHRDTEALLNASPIPSTMLRNGWYSENHANQAGLWLGPGILLGAAGEGRHQPASRRDFAQAAAIVLSGDDPEPRVYELAGDESVSHAEIADLASEVAGRPVIYHALSEAEYAHQLRKAGLPPEMADLVAGCDVGISRGELSTDSKTLSELLGRPTTPMIVTVREAIAAIRAGSAS
jgi:NAD(P)H dehydrogenase (quinone)